VVVVAAPTINYKQYPLLLVGTAAFDYNEHYLTNSNKQQIGARFLHCIQQHNSDFIKEGRNRL
jgi:hypothetical protein